MYAQAIVGSYPTPRWPPNKAMAAPSPKPSPRCPITSASTRAVHATPKTTIDSLTARMEPPVSSSASEPAVSAVKNAPARVGGAVRARA
ncbi:hypothetical protein AB0C28_51345 [Nonomuraea sp. NPDC048892]|uniref:hypothetical protein n=1 Tax=Nonomuraea sp. NPDC048892 TaxID=3154624 RepID=UPI0033F2EC47